MVFIRKHVTDVTVICGLAVWALESPQVGQHPSSFTIDFGHLPNFLHLKCEDDHSVYTLHTVALKMI